MFRWSWSECFWSRMYWICVILEEILTPWRCWASEARYGSAFQLWLVVYTDDSPESWLRQRHLRFHSFFKKRAFLLSFNPTAFLVKLSFPAPLRIKPSISSISHIVNDLGVKLVGWMSFFQTTCSTWGFTGSSAAAQVQIDCWIEGK